MSDTWNTLTAFWNEHVKGTNIHMYIHFYPLVHLVQFSAPGPDVRLLNHVAIDPVLERNPEALHDALLHAITELKNESRNRNELRNAVEAKKRIIKQKLALHENRFLQDKNI